MSIQALSWAIEDAPDVPAHCVGTLLGLANHAQSDGRGAFPTLRRLSRYARKDEQSIRRDIRTLAQLGLIREGDQRFVAHIEPDRRPRVWDLAIERKRAAGVSPATGRGVSPATGRGVSPAIPKPSVEPSIEPASASRSVAPPAPTAQTLLAEYIDWCPRRPPTAVLGQLGRQVRQMLDADHIEPGDIRRGLTEWHAKGLHPSTLPSVVNEVMNGGSGARLQVATRTGTRVATTDQRMADIEDLRERVIGHRKELQHDTRRDR